MRDSQIHISKSKVLYNYKLIKNYANNINLAPVIKANAFGHGASLMASIFAETDCKMVTVAYISEAIELRESGYKKEILLLVPPVEKDIDAILEYNLQTTIAEEKTATLLNGVARKSNKLCKVHIFLNTGMNREGKKPYKILDFFDLLISLKNIKIEGILSHFASSDLEDNLFNNFQISQFKKVIDLLAKKRHSIPLKHIHNSASIFNYLSLEDKSYFDLFRPGIASYGLLADRKRALEIGLKPVLELKTKVHHLIEVKKGETCGYNFQFTAEFDGKLAIIPIGFGDGISRNLTNKMEVIINNKFYKIAGLISMDLIIIDIKNDNVNQGDEVIIIGSNGEKEITVYDLADKLGTITYEITTSLSRRLPRLIVE